MSDEQTLLAVIAVIYLADCLYWIPRNGLAFSKWIGANWKTRQGSALLGNPRGGFSLANPLPPLGIVTRSIGWTISISPEGACSFYAADIANSGRPPQVGAFFSWPQINKIERDGRKIFVNGALFFIAVTEYSARRIAHEISVLVRKGRKERESCIRNILADSLDSARARARIENFLSETRRLKILTNALFLFLFAICPLLVWRYGIVTAILPLAAGLYLQTSFIAWEFRRAHKKIYPEDDEQIFKPCFTMFLAAPSAIRARDILGRPLLEEFHPVVLAPELKAWVARDLRNPRLPVASPEARETEEWFRAELLKLIGEANQRNQSPSEPENVAYCPRCLQQYTSHASVCADCGGLPLVGFKREL